jgi:hypothetical protein
MPDILAMRAIMLALGGKDEEAASAAAEAAAMVRVLTASGKAAAMQASSDVAQEALDFHAIIADLKAGNAVAARTKFTARSHWRVPAVPAVADLAAKLRQNAPPADLTGALATDPATMRSNGLTANAAAITEAANADSLLYSAVRLPLTAAIYLAWADDVWDTKSSAFLHQRAANENYIGDIMVVSRAPGLFKPPHLITVAAGEALLMHSALMAQARGVKGFELALGRKQFEAFVLRFGNPGDPEMPTAVAFDAATVIADLAAAFPDPRTKSAPGPSQANH